MAKTWSGKLRVLQREKGVKVVVTAGRDIGREVEFAPRYETDRKPWIVKTRREFTFGSDTYRYNGRDCRPVYPKEGSADG